MPSQPLPRVLFFDVFGTVVEWRTPVSKALHDAAQSALQDPKKDLSDAVRAKVSSMTQSDWLAITEEWRESYHHFTQNRDPSKPFVPVDEHHYSYLLTLLQAHGLETLFTDAQRWDLAMSWHRLTPWPDTVRGLELLNRKFRTCTLSNGNVALLEDLCRYGSLPFTEVLSAEHFGAYKPSPKVYGGAAERFGVEPGGCALVAAHLRDLKGAKACGLQTIYVERLKEETLDVEQARDEGYVDIWIDASCDGLVELARRFGIDTESKV
ncbi:haloacid dehalogenase, type II [Aspergillus lentulus]|uniref:Haloacid dehalogenase, type II n=1 Tax=Aspergillus lentulus TaxID=293939 RepID=A0ABQ1AXA0_ASPLE|nr:haloacid dehalogenase, type II [Aspergillus lentulus]GFF50194.1 haloacid dehalogenase, type II [Aspergillus lentulus]GFF74284.1 haloacid dehalogenase, type II [Aspergillus lentulus]GFF88666.1 haloacid dehalogenase, type II [Aspergillus lentulus]GFF89762.1 haloacid dehalogenase, type II [Aspergillus lentulus]GFG15522.1 haloacid dehalogenase, type II [Aspergillus lentulus]